MRKLLFFIFALTFLFGIFNFAFALRSFSEGGFVQEKQIEINSFYSSTCPRCAQEEKFLEELEEKYPEIKTNKLFLSKRENLELLKNLYQDYNVPSQEQGYVPITFIEDRYFLGFSEKIGQDIENCILQLIVQEPCGPKKPREKFPEKIEVPFIGEIDISRYSLATLAVLLGTLDGFNLCSLGALVLILGLVLALRSRKKTLIFGGLFILTTAVVYGFLIVLWYQIFSLLVSYLKIMEILIGLLAIGAGIYFLRQFIKFKKYDPTCEVNIGKGIMSKFSSKFQETFKGSGNIFLLIGAVFIFAAIITIVEFPCSAVAPVVFAGVLSQSHPSGFLYLFYITLFVFFYMLDEIIVFLVAFLTMKIWLTSSKIINWITLIEAIILFLLGFFYLFGFSALL